MKRVSVLTRVGPRAKGSLLGIRTREEASRALSRLLSLQAEYHKPRLAPSAVEAPGDPLGWVGASSSLLTSYSGENAALRVAADGQAAQLTYTRMADDDSLFKMAQRIQLRAFKRMGELLESFKQDPFRQPQTTPR